MSPPTKESMLAAYAELQVQIDITLIPSGSKPQPLGWTPTSPTHDSPTSPTLPTTCSIIVHSPSGRVVAPIFHDPNSASYIPGTSYPHFSPAETQPELFPPPATEILPGLFLSDTPTATSAPALRAHGITHVVAVLRDDYPLPPFPPGVRCLRVPAEDAGRAAQLGYMEQAVQWMAHAFDDPGSRVLVHCTPLVVAFVMAQKELGLRTAWALVCARRRVAYPSRGCMLQLLAYERRCRDLQTVRQRHLMAVKAMVDDWKRYKKGRPSPDPFKCAGSKVLALS